MKQAEYLGTILGTKYKLTTYEVDVLAAALAEVYRTGTRINLIGAPLLWEFSAATDEDIYEVVRQGSSYWGLLSRLGGAQVAGDVYYTLMSFMTKDDAPSDLRKVAMVILTEWPEGKEHAERARQISPDQDEAPRRSVSEQLREHAGVEALYQGWVATGKFPLEVQGEHEGQIETTIIDLDQQLEGDHIPAIVNIARLMRATWNPEAGIVEPTRIEAMCQLLAGLFNAERKVFEQKLNEVAQTRAEPASIWPKDDGHWIFDPQTAVITPGLKMAHDHPSRLRVEAAVSRAARFAVSRASGLGTSRVFNIEGFVNNVAIGLLGDGEDGESFDIGEVFGRQEVHIPCSRPHVGEEAELGKTQVQQ